MRLPLCLPFLMAALAVSGLADSSTAIGHPAMGFVYDSGSQSVRLLTGIPGASVLGDPLEAGFPIAAAAISPRQDFILAVAAGSGEVRLVEFRQNQALVSALPGVVPNPSRLVPSDGGSAAALYYDSSRRLQIVTGLPGNPSLQREILLPELIASPTAIAVSDDGELTLILSAGAAWLALGETTPARLNLPEPVAAIGFRAGTHAALFAAPGARLYLARNLDADFAYREMRTALENDSAPIAVQFSQDGLRGHVVLSNGTLVSTDLQSGSSESRSCRCAPTGLQRLSPGSLFRLNDLSALPLMLFDSAERESQIWFVPSLPPVAGAQRSRQ